MSEGREYFEVEADIGIHAWGPTLAACFRQCALAVFDLIVPVASVTPGERREVAAQGESPDVLLVNWVNEMLFLHDVEGFALHDLDPPMIEQGRIHAVLLGEPVDPDRHPRGIQVKAATYHQLAVTEGSDRVDARMILDI